MNQWVWTVAEPPTGPVSDLARELHVSNTLASLLVSRGYTTVESAHAFLNPSPNQLHDPMLLPQIEEAVSRIRLALERREKILVYGDYDVDGTTGTALLTRVLRVLGADVVYRVPHRQRDGYDLHESTVDEAHADGVSLIVTVDCGSSAIGAVERARELGIDVVITDHHSPGPELPRASAVVNPHRSDSRYPFPELAGVGVALKVAMALSRLMGHNGSSILQRFADLAALGTVADVMPLVGENRVIVTYGLRALPTTQKLGLRALIRTAGMEGRKLEAYHLGFVFGPRLNAVGRMGDANLALELLLTKDETAAARLAQHLDETNRLRQDEQSRILEEALAQASQYDMEQTRVLVLSSSGWHAGVIGIVASKIVETCNRPAILISEADGVGRGSCRSIESFHICDALSECNELLARYGGHAMAAGFDLPLENLEDFRNRINDVGKERIADDDLVPRLAADMVLDPRHIGLRLAEELELMAPFGTGNPRPVFISKGVELIACTTVGNDGAHLKLRVLGENSVPLDCMGWRRGDLCAKLSTGTKYDLCYELGINVFNGSRSAQMILKDIQPAT